MNFEHHDGGRQEAGFKGKTGDCVVRAIAIATGLPYGQVYNDLKARMKADKKTKNTPRNGVPRHIFQPYLEELGWQWHPTMKIGQGCRVHLTKEELPPGMILARVSKHFVAVKDGTVYDIHDCTRKGSRCVYGYFRRA